MKAAFLLVLSLTAATWAQDQEELAEQMLQNHDQMRNIHQAVNMTLTDDLNNRAQYCAQYYANKDTIDHTCPENNGVGENLAAVGYIGSPDYSDAINSAANMWYNENQGYNYTDPGNSQGVTGHFTQMVWNASTQLGTGVANNASSNYVYIVSLYSPQGNMQMYGDDTYEMYRENVFPAQD